MKNVLTRDQAKILVKATIRSFKKYKSVGEVVRRRVYKLIRFKVAKALSVKESTLFKRICKLSGLHMTSINDYRVVAKVEILLGLEQGVMKIKPLKRLTELAHNKADWDPIYTIAEELCGDDQVPNTPLIERAFDVFEDRQDGIVIGNSSNNAPVADKAKAKNPSSKVKASAKASKSVKNPEMERLQGKANTDNKVVGGSMVVDDNQVIEVVVHETEVKADLRYKAKLKLKVDKEIDNFSESEELEYRSIWKTKNRVLRAALMKSHCEPHTQLVAHVKGLR